MPLSNINTHQKVKSSDGYINILKGFYNKSVKTSIYLIASPLTKIINQCLASVCFPDKLKNN